MRTQRTANTHTYTHAREMIHEKQGSTSTRTTWTTWVPTTGGHAYAHATAGTWWHVPPTVLLHIRPLPARALAGAQHHIPAAAHTTTQHTSMGVRGQWSVSMATGHKSHLQRFLDERVFLQECTGNPMGVRAHTRAGTRMQGCKHRAKRAQTARTCTLTPRLLAVEASTARMIPASTDALMPVSSSVTPSHWPVAVMLTTCVQLVLTMGLEKAQTAAGWRTNSALTAVRGWS